MSRGNWLILISLGLALPFGVVALFPDDRLSPICSLAMLLIYSLGILWGLWRGDLQPKRVLPSIPLFGAMLIIIHGQSVPLTLERYVLAMLLGAIAVLVLERTGPVR